EMVGYHGRMLGLGVRVIGGCCGTTPAHISAMKRGLAGMDQRYRKSGPSEEIMFLSSRSGHLAIGGGNPTAVIGERINPTGKKAFAAELREGKISYIRREAVEQTAAGATLLDINVGAPGIDEPAAMERAIFCVTG